MAVRFMKQLRSDLRFKHSLVIGLIEYTGERFRPQLYDEWWSNFPPYHSARDPRDESTDPRPGVPTLELEKRAYVNLLKSRLHHGTIYLEEKVFTLCDPTEMHIKLNTQMKNFCIVRERKIVDGEPKYKIKYSGKHAGADDACMSLQLGLYHSDYLKEKSTYLKSLVGTGPIRCSAELAEPSSSGVFGSAPKPAAVAAGIDEKKEKVKQSRKRKKPTVDSSSASAGDQTELGAQEPAAKVTKKTNGTDAAAADAPVPILQPRRGFTFAVRRVTQPPPPPPPASDADGDVEMSTHD
jgi:hypothetical protein